MAKVKYEFNPYTFARISAMKSLLLQKKDYDRIMKMDVPEIIKFLQEGVYSEEINKLAVKYSGIKLVENSLNSHLGRIFQKLRRISDENLQYLMDQYLRRYDFWNLKTLLRAKQTKLPEEKLREMFMPVGSLSIEELKELYPKTVREILNKVKIIEFSEVRDAVEDFENRNDLSEIENLLDYHYYNDTAKFASEIPEHGKLFREFFRHEIDIYNIELILKKIFFGLEEDYVKDYLIEDGKDLSKERLEKLFQCKNLAEFKKEISRTPYKKVFAQEPKEEENALLMYEVLLEGFLLKKSILLYHQHPLTVDVVLGYMFSKEIEANNIRTIVKSKALEFTEDYVKNLVIT